MRPQHTRAGETHDLSHMLPGFPPIAVDRALGACRFLNAVGTAIELGVRIFRQLAADVAKLGPSVMVTTVHLHHGLDGASLTADSCGFVASAHG